MFTGHTSHEIGLARNNVPMPDSLRATTLGVLMQHAGYECAYAGKWHVHTASIPDREFGFSVLHPHTDHGLAEASVAFLEREHTRPFFLVVGFDNPTISVNMHVGRICHTAICLNFLKTNGLDCP